MKRVVAASNVMVKRVGNEAVLLNLDSEVFYSLNSSGIRMWEVMTTTSSVDEASQTLSKEYNVPIEIISADLNELVDHLLAANLIEVLD